MALHSVSGTATATNIAIILELQNVKAGTVDGVWIAISPNKNGTTPVLPASVSTSDLVAADNISGASAINWFYGCAKGNATGTAVDAVVKNFFKNGNTILKC